MLSWKAIEHSLEDSDYAIVKIHDPEGIVVFPKSWEDESKRESEYLYCFVALTSSVDHIEDERRDEAIGVIQTLREIGIESQWLYGYDGDEGELDYRLRYFEEPLSNLFVD